MVDITIKKKQLNNKSRKGTYMYVREKGKKGSYYKFKEGISIDNYVLAYKGKIKIKKKGVITFEKKSEAKNYLKKINNKDFKIDRLISKGITNTEIQRGLIISRTEEHKAYSNMLRPLVRDKELLSILALNENVKKFKHRIQTNIIVVGDGGKVNFELVTFNKTLEEINEDFNEIKNKRGIFERDIKRILDKGYKYARIPTGFDIKDYESNLVTNKVESMKIRLRFVKGR